MTHWSLETIAWEKFDRSKVRPELLSLAKAASMVESNGAVYARYLCEVFHDDPSFQSLAHQWAKEEVQHGEALRRWAEMADPAFDYQDSFRRFAEGYSLPQNVVASVRGSCSGELIARCVVETGTATYYSAIADATDEPVLKEICRKIAADELRHYKLFYTTLKGYLVKEKIGKIRRLRIALGRIAESEDDELAYAYFAAHGSQGTYERKLHSERYLSLVYPLYRPSHVERMVAMVFKAVGLKPEGRFARLVHRAAWQVMQWRNRKLQTLQSNSTSAGLAVS